MVLEQINDNTYILFCRAWKDKIIIFYASIKQLEFLEHISDI